MILLYIAFGFCLFLSLLLTFMFYSHVRREDTAIRERILSFSSRRNLATAEAAIERRRQRTRMAAQLAANARELRARWGLRETQETSRMLAIIGLNGPMLLEGYIAFRFALGGLACALISTVTHQVIPLVGLAVAGYLVPEYILHHLVKRYQQQIRKALPELVDLLLICIEGGFGIDQSIKRVADDLQYGFPAMYEGLQLVIRTQNLGVPRIQAWQEFVSRSGSEDVKSFVSMLEQSDKYGTPIARSLQTFADMLRLKRRQDAEKRAAKVPIKMLFPLVFFIFPCIFVVLLGPPVIQFLTSQFTLSQLKPAATRPQKESPSWHQTQYAMYRLPSSSLCSSSSFSGGAAAQRQNTNG